MFEQRSPNCILQVIRIRDPDRHRTRLGGGPHSLSEDFAPRRNIGPPLCVNHVSTAPTLAQLFSYEQIYNGPPLAAKDGPTIKLWLAHRWATNKLLSHAVSVFLNALCWLGHLTRKTRPRYDL